VEESREGGHTWEQIIDGAARYNVFCVDTGKVGTEIVMQAATFCGPDKPFLQPWTLPRNPRANGAADASAAWDRVMSHCKTGAYRKGGLGEDRIDAAVKSIGGYATIAMGNTSQLPFFKRQFVVALKGA
jgi:hypothetical protein